MKITFVGLGNKGREYNNTRHNTGFMFVDYLLNKLGGSGEDFKTNKKIKSMILEIDDFILVKPQTMMNRSGVAVKAYLNFYKPDSSNRLYVVHDDLDLQLGNYKVSDTGPKDHNGINSIETELGRKDFDRVRIGIENRSDKNIPGEVYVLQKFSETELDKLEKTFSNISNELIY